MSKHWKKIIALFVIGTASAAGLSQLGEEAQAPLTTAELKAPKEKVFEKGRYTEDGREVVKYTYISSVEVLDETLPLTKKQVNDELKKDSKVKVKEVKDTFTEDVSMRTGNTKFFKLGKTEDDKDIVQAQIFPGLQMTKEIATGKWFHVEVATTTAEVFAMETRPTLKERVLAFFGAKAQADTATFYPDPSVEVTSVDGEVYRGEFVNEPLATIRAGAGQWVWDGDTSGQAALLTIAATNPNFARLRRAIILFDTSTLGSSAVISAATLSLYGTGSKADQLGGTPEVDIVSSNPASNTALAASDYSNLGTTPYASISVASFAASYNDFSLDSNGITNINKTGVSKFGVTLNWDTDNNFTGSWTGTYKQTTVYFYLAERAGTSEDPKLVVTYTTGGGSTPAPQPFINFD